MKKIVWLGVGLLVLGLPVWAEEAPGTGGEIAEADLNNKVNAVTFFPAPYVAYSRIQVNKALEAGLVKNNRMNLGYLGFTGYALNVPNTGNGNVDNEVYLLGGTKFGFNGPVVLGKLTVKDGSSSNKNELFFSSTLRLADFCSGKNEDDSPCTASSSSSGVNGHPGYSINSRVLKVLCPNNVCNLKLFGKPFPVCSNNGSQQISWQMAALGSNPAQQELYLACGEYSDCSWWKQDTATEWHREEVGGLMPLNVQQMKCQAMTDPAPAQSACNLNASTEPILQGECAWRNNDGCYCKTWKWTCIHCGGQG
ncbi:MAG: hypothetical protein MJ053_05745 [Elusimicrobiaceae bacterium]|nr:hypothetical protein [Elusimicrobiaceae bacterium]